MSPFLPTLFTVALVEIGAANAQFSASLTARETPPATTLRALGLITLGVMALAAAGGYALNSAEQMNTRVVTLLLGMALIWAAIAQFRLLKPIAEVEGQDPNIVALRGYARLALTGSAGFLVFAIGLYSGAGIDGLLGAAFGGWIGVIVANVPPILLSKRQVRNLHIGGLRILAGVLLALTGFIYALTALKLI
jgi:hypothetical protein